MGYDVIFTIGPELHPRYSNLPEIALFQRLKSYVISAINWRAHAILRSLHIQHFFPARLTQVRAATAKQTVSHSCLLLRRWKDWDYRNNIGNQCQGQESAEILVHYDKGK